MPRHRTHVAVAFLVALLVCSSSATAQSANDLNAFVGRWKINLGQTKMNRMGPNGNNLVRSPTFTFIFAADNPGLRMDVYAEYPQPAPSRVTSIVPDQKQHSCETKSGCLTVGGNPDEQAFSYFRINSHMLVRLFYEKGKPSEYTTYAVSTDGSTFTMITWSAETPQWQNIQVFDKQP